MNKKSGTTPDLLRFGVHFAFDNLFRTYIGFGCLFISMPAMGGWKVVIPWRDVVRPWCFEHYLGKTSERDRIQNEGFRRAAREKKAHASEVGGLWDAYAPVISRGRVVGALISGSYACQDLQPSEISGRWKDLTGAAGSDRNLDYLRFARTMLDAPVFDKPARKAFLHVMEMMGRWVGGDDDPPFIPQIERYHERVFAAIQPHPGWVKWIIGADKFDSQNYERHYIEPWVRKEMGLTRIPTVVAALMPRDEGKKSGVVETMCRNRRFQRECFRVTRRIPESVATDLGDYGSLVLTSPKPGVSPVKARFEVRDRMRHLAATLEKTIGSPVAVGIGGFYPGGENLGRSQREAVSALYQALATGREPVFSEMGDREWETAPHEAVRSAMRALTDAFEQGAVVKMTTAREKLISEVMVASLGQLETARTYLSTAQQRLLTSFEQKGGIGITEGHVLGDTWTRRLMEASSTPELVNAFQDAVMNLAHYQTVPREAEASVKIESVLRDMSLYPGRPWHVRKICRMIQVSPPTFLKWFHKHAGSAFRPYLNRLRLEKAREMLMEGDLPLARVAQECGYNSISAFIGFFRRGTGLTPNDFRIKSVRRRLNK